MMSKFSKQIALFSLSLTFIGPARAADALIAVPVNAVLQKMTLDEKLSLVDGGGRSDARCVGSTPAIARLSIPALCMGDGPAGVGNGLHGVTMFPAPIALAASWDIGLAASYGAAQAEEQKGKGRNVALLPTVNILRSPLWGRAAETLGEDPVLTASLGTAIVEGIQSRHVIAMPKHFAANNQETDRFGDAPDWTAVDAIVPERALREIYLPAFESAVRTGGAQAIMCAYNRINGAYACDNQVLLGILRNEWKFNGFVTSDWLFAGRSTSASIRAGEDQLMPGGRNPYGLADYYGEPLRQALAAGSVKTSDLDNMVLHILNAITRVGVTDPAPDAASKNVRTDAHGRLVEAIDGDGIVLLKNDRNVLPIGNRDKRIAIIGPDGSGEAEVTEVYGGFVPPDPAHPVPSPLQAIRHRAAGRQIVFSAGTAGIRPLPALPDGLIDAPDGRGKGWTLETETNLSAAPLLTNLLRIDAAAVSAHPGRVRWQGSFVPRQTGDYRFSIAGGGTASVLVDGVPIAGFAKEEFNAVAHGAASLVSGRRTRITVSYDPGSGILTKRVDLGWSVPSSLRAEAVAAAAKADIAIVFASDIVSEGADRLSLALPGDQDGLIAAVAASNPRTVVVLNTVGPVLTPWRNKVAGVIEAWYGGEANAAALTGILFGDRDPSGRLPETFPASADQGATAIGAATFPGIDHRVHYDEGLLVGYRYYDAHRQVPAFPFGYGLSYTRFALSALREEAHRTIAVDVVNTGARPGTAVTQLYVTFPSGAHEPPRQLKAFGKVMLEAGARRRVRFALDDRALRSWSVVRHAWLVVPGHYKVAVGFSSRDLPLETTVDVKD